LLFDAREVTLRLLANVIEACGMNMWVTALWVGGGGFVGSVARYAVTVALQRTTPIIPLGTLTVNVLGCLLMGVLVGRTSSLAPEVRLALATGFCGGFTTMSTMMYESATLIKTGEYIHTAVYIVCTFLLCLMAFGLGVYVSRAT